MLSRLALALVVLLVPPARAGLELWDTGKPSAEPLPLSALEAKSGWTKVSDAGAIKGDAVLSNGRLTVVVRRAGSADLYSPAAARARVFLQTADGKTLPKFDKISVTENSKGAIAIEVAGPSAAATLKLKKGDPALETAPGAGAGRLRVETPSRFAVFPDFFADDIVVDATKIPAAAIEAPSENFLLNLGGKNDSIVMSVFENRDQDVKLTLGGEGAARAFSGSEIQFGKAG